MTDNSDFLHSGSCLSLRLSRSRESHLCSSWLRTSTNLTALILNKLRGVLNVLRQSRLPTYGDRRKRMLETSLFSPSSEQSSRSLALTSTRLPLTCRSCKSVKVTKGHYHRWWLAPGSEIDDRITQIKAEIRNTTSDFDREVGERLASSPAALQSSRLAQLPRLSSKEIKRIEDALQATRAAVEEGIVAGGGTFLAASSVLDSVQPLMQTRRSALGARLPSAPSLTTPASRAA